MNLVDILGVRNWCSSRRANRWNGVADHSWPPKCTFYCQGVLRKQPRSTSCAPALFCASKITSWSNVPVHDMRAFLSLSLSSTSLSMIPSRRSRALPPLFVCQLLIWRLMRALTTGLLEWDKPLHIHFAFGLGYKLVTGAPHADPTLKAAELRLLACRCFSSRSGASILGLSARMTSNPIVQMRWSALGPSASTCC
jgi:hypothetical protein